MLKMSEGGWRVVRFTTPEQARPDHDRSVARLPPGASQQRGDSQSLQQISNSHSELGSHVHERAQMAPDLRRNRS